MRVGFFLEHRIHALLQVVHEDVETLTYFSLHPCDDANSKIIIVLSILHFIIYWVMLTCALRHMLKNKKNNFALKNIIFLLF